MASTLSFCLVGIVGAFCDALLVHKGTQWELIISTSDMQGEPELTASLRSLPTLDAE